MNLKEKELIFILELLVNYEDKNYMELTKSKQKFISNLINKLEDLTTKNEV